MSTASPQRIAVLIWLLCTTVLIAFLDNRPDPPATKPGVVAAASISHVLTNAFSSQWEKDQSAGTARMDPPHWVAFATVLTAEQDAIRIPPAHPMSGLSPPCAA